MCKIRKLTAVFGLVVLVMVSGAVAYEGYSPLTDGGAGGTTISVTNLNDSGAGSFRAALAGISGATIIEFDVSGVICPESKLQLTDPYVTIDGSSAPGAGITLCGSELGLEPILEINTHDVIVNDLRFRNSPKEGIQLTGDNDIIIDHCSITGSADGALDINGGIDHVVVSRCLFGGNVEVHRSYGIYTSLHHNFYAWNNRRQPKIYKAGAYYDFRNNLVENWTNTGTNIQLSTKGVNIINNYYGPPAPGETCSAGFHIGGASSNVYTDGNYSTCAQDIDSLGDLGSPVTEPNVTTDDVCDVPSEVLADVGAQPNDSIDDYYLEGGGTSPPSVGSCGSGGPTPTPGGPTPTPGGGSDTFYSVDTKDGTVEESSETSDVGGAYNTTHTYIGDNSSKEQYMGVFSFDTSAIPDGATISSATFQMRRLGSSGTPTSLGDLKVDIKTGYYGAADTLRANDFEAASTATNVATLSYPASNGSWASGSLNSSGYSAINKTGLTQIKVRFATDDDNDGTADHLNIYDSASNAELYVEW